MRRMLVAASACGLLLLGSGTAYADTANPPGGGTELPTTPAPTSPTSPPDEETPTPTPSPTSSESTGNGKDDGDVSTLPTQESEQGEDEPNLWVAPVAHPGQQTGAAASNCKPNELVKFTTKQGDAVTVLAEQKASEQGYARVDFTVPKSFKPGESYTIKANCGSKSLSAPIYVIKAPGQGDDDTGSFYVSDTTIHLGQEIDLWGGGCSYSEQAQVTITATFPNGKTNSQQLNLTPRGNFGGSYALKQYTFADKTYTLSAACEGAEFTPITLTVVPKPGGDGDDNGGGKDDDGKQAASNDQKELPFTGANIAIVAAVAAVLLGAGTGLVIVTRRRRNRSAETTPEATA